MVPNIDVNRYRRCFQDSRNVDRGKLQKLGLGSYLKPKMSPVLKDTSSACARRGSPTQPCSAAALTSPSTSGLHRSGEPMSQCPTATATSRPPEEVSPALLRLQLHPPLPPFDPSPTPVALLPFLSLFGPFCALTHSRGRGGLISRSLLPARWLTRARSLVALPSFPY